MTFVHSCTSFLRERKHRMTPLCKERSETGNSRREEGGLVKVDVKVRWEPNYRKEYPTDNYKQTNKTSWLKAEIGNTQNQEAHTRNSSIRKKERKKSRDGGGSKHYGTLTTSAERGSWSPTVARSISNHICMACSSIGGQRIVHCPPFTLFGSSHNGFTFFLKRRRL